MEFTIIDSVFSEKYISLHSLVVIIIIVVVVALGILIYLVHVYVPHFKSHLFDIIWRKYSVDCTIETGDNCYVIMGSCKI